MNNERCAVDSPCNNTVGIGTAEVAVDTKGRDVTIKRVLNGFIVKCGCQTVVFEQQDHMLLELNRYYNNPIAVEKEYQSKFGK